MSLGMTEIFMILFHSNLSDIDLQKTWLLTYTQIAFQIVSALARRWRRQNDAVLTVAYIETMLARFEMLSGYRSCVVFTRLYFFVISDNNN